MPYLPRSSHSLLRPHALAGALVFLGVWAAGVPACAANAFAEPTPAERAAGAPEGGTQPIKEVATGNADAHGQATWSVSTLQRMNTAQVGDRLDLAQAWRLTVLNDPGYQAALSARAAAETERRQGRAAILPQVQAGYSRSRITGTQTQYAMGRSATGDLDYDSTSMYVQLQQPVINLGRYADFQRGAARAQLGEAEFKQREQETALLLAETYFEALRAETQWQLAVQLAESLRKQAVAQDRLYEANEGDRIDAQETRSRLALAESEEIRARDARNVALRELEAMVGRPVEAIAGLAADFQPIALQPPALRNWIELARQQNPAVQVARERVRVAETELSRATSSFLPTLDLIASWAKADSENLSSLSQRTNTWAVGLNASIPIFTGGYNSANRARASAELDQVRQELRAAEEAAIAEVTRQYTALIGGEQRIRALLVAVQSSEQSLVAAEESYRYGIRSNVDVLRSQDRLYESRRELAGATIDYLYAAAALRSAAGALGEQDFVEISAGHLGN